MEETLKQVTKGTLAAATACSNVLPMDLKLTVNPEGMTAEAHTDRPAESSLQRRLREIEKSKTKTMTAEQGKTDPFEVES
jgi:hypothetical protein